MYTCGPTVYSYAHIGNFRAYIFEDLLQRHLEFRGYRVRRVMNLTDVDDKTIRNAQQSGVPLREFTATFKDAFFADLDALAIKRADHYPAATDPENIARMIEMIELLVTRGHAYQADDGSVYFRLASFPAYGSLAQLNLDELRPGGRVQNDEYEKENIADFALWKAWDTADGDVAWDSPWGRGRPGWHIECSAMATRLLGDELDIHCGGVDNIFPHHEAELAQSECCTGKAFVRTWMHCAHLMVDGRKMAKSAGNFYTLRDLMEKGYSGREVRYALLCVHYRLPLNLRMESLDAARSSLQRIDEWIARLHVQAADAAPLCTHIYDEQDAFGTALDDDLNSSSALAALFDVIRHSHRAMDSGELSASQAATLLQWWESINSVLAISQVAAAVPAEILHLVEQREAARASKQWALSDTLRDTLLSLGWEVKDTKQGQQLKAK